MANQVTKAKRGFMLLLDNSKEKMIHAMIFFVKNTNYCYKLKLLKLLYFLDFENFRQTGRSVTGLDYFAWPKGPVPNELYDMIELTVFLNEVKTSHSDIELSKAFSIESINDRVIFKPKIEFNKKIFSINELKIMKAIAKRYKETNSEDMIKVTHAKEGVWYKVYYKDKNPQGQISYLKILEDKRPDTIPIDEAKEREQDDKAIRKIFT